MKRIIIILALLLFTATHGVFAQRTITGRAINGEDGLPMPGVYVSVKGTTTATQTNTVGNFSLIVPNNRAVIAVSFTGFKTIEVPVGSSTQFTFTLQPDPVVLGEVVVTARRNNQPEKVVIMGIERDTRSLPSAVTVVSGDAIRKAAGTTWIEALVSTVPSLTIRTIRQGAGASIQVILRGIPVTLIVIDGVPYETNLGKNMSASDRYRAIQEGQELNNTSNILGMINPSDIESVTVIRGGNMAALYGIGEALNGAIIITTKKQ